MSNPKGKHSRTYHCQEHVILIYQKQLPATNLIKDNPLWIQELIKDLLDRVLVMDWGLV